MNTITRNLAAAMLLSTAGATPAHHSVAMFDTATPVTISGQVVRFEMSNPHSYLYVEQQTESGPLLWAVEGPAPNRLDRIGVGTATFIEGAAVEACGYVLKEDANGRYNDQRVLVAEVIVLPAGEARLWSPYGNTLCREGNRYPPDLR